MRTAFILVLQKKYLTCELKQKQILAKCLVLLVLSQIVLSLRTKQPITTQLSSKTPILLQELYSSVWEAAITRVRLW